MTPCPSERSAIGTVLLLACAACGILVATAGHAASARLTALAGEDVIEDAGDAVRWFGATSDYSRTLRVHWGDYRPAAPAPMRVTRQVAGVVTDLGGRDGRWSTGLYLYGDQPDRTLQGLLARRLCAAQLGLSLAWNDREAPVGRTAGEGAWSDRELEVGLGCRADLGRQMYLDAVAAWTTARGQWRGTHSSPAEQWQGLSAARCRLFVALGQTTVLVPIVTWQGSDRRTPVSDLEEIYRRNGDTWDLRLGLLLLPDPDTSWHVTVGWRRQREVLTRPLLRPAAAPTGTRDLSAWLLRLGWEHRVSAWCSLRSGATTVIVDRDGTLPGAAAAPRAGFDLVVGAAFHVGEVDLDVAVSDDPPALPRLGDHSDPLAASRAWTSVTLTALF